jgi:hypothetical protein
MMRGFRIHRNGTDHPDQGPYEGLRIIGLVHAFHCAPQVFSRLFRPPPLLRTFQLTLSFLVGGSDFETRISFGDVLHGFPVACVADQKAETRYTARLPATASNPERKK